MLFLFNMTTWEHFQPYIGATFYIIFQMFNHFLAKKKTKNPDPYAKMGGGF